MTCTPSLRARYRSERTSTPEKKRGKGRGKRDNVDTDEDANTILASCSFYFADRLQPTVVSIDICGLSSADEPSGGPLPLNIGVMQKAVDNDDGGSSSSSSSSALDDQGLASSSGFEIVTSVGDVTTSCPTGLDDALLVVEMEPDVQYMVYVVRGSERRAQSRQGMIVNDWWHPSLDVAQKSSTPLENGTYNLAIEKLALPPPSSCEMIGDVNCDGKVRWWWSRYFGRETMPKGQRRDTGMPGDCLARTHSFCFGHPAADRPRHKHYHPDRRRYRVWPRNQDGKWRPEPGRTARRWALHSVNSSLTSIDRSMSRMES